MSFWTRFTRHEMLFSRMADRAGADPDLAMQSGDLEPEDYRSAILSCSICSKPDACERLLDTSGNDVPSYCRNQDLLKRLAVN